MNGAPPATVAVLPPASESGSVRARGVGVIEAGGAGADDTAVKAPRAGIRRIREEKSPRAHE